MAVEWTITIEGRNEFGDVCRKAVRIDKSREHLFDGDLGLSIEDGKTIMTALQSAVVNHEAETYSLFRRVCPDCHRFRPVKDYTTRRIRTVFGIVEVRNPRWMLCIWSNSWRGRRLRKETPSSPSPGTVRNSVCGRAVEHYAAIALMKRSPKMTANWALAMVHSRGGIFHSFSDRFKIR
ncbi:hypothetical protein ACVILI_006838 [Mesorhizobium sp. USDA 4775]